MMCQIRYKMIELSVICIVLSQLDCDDDSGMRGEEDEPDFYVQAHMPV